MQNTQIDPKPLHGERGDGGKASVLERAPDTATIIADLRLDEATGVRFGPLGLELPEDMDEAAWAKLGNKLLRMERIFQWWIGDWAHFGDGSDRAQGWRKKGALKLFCEANGIDYGTTCNASWVSGSIHYSLRSESLEYSFYKEVAPLKPKEQKKWLSVVQEEGIPVAELRRRIRYSQGEESALDSDGPILASGIRLHEELDAWLATRDADFWQPDRIQIWKLKLRKSLERVPD